MMPENTDKILDADINQLDFSDKFRRDCTQMGFSTLADVIAKKPEEIRMLKGFSYTWLGELSEFLNKHRLLHLLQPTPGKSYG